MIKVAICGKLKTAMLIGRYLHRNFTENTVYSVTYFFAGEEAVLNNEFNFDIIFAEIDLSCLKGIETVKRIRKIAPSGVLFVIPVNNAPALTDVLKLGVFKILSKSFDEEKFKQDMLTAVKLHEDNNSRLIIKAKGNIVNLNIQNIILITVHMKKIVIITVSGRISCNGAINKFSEKLSGKGFAHCHKSFLVNLNYVKIIGAKELKLEGCDDFVPVSRGFRSNFIKQYEIHFADKIL